MRNSVQKLVVLLMLSVSVMCSYQNNAKVTDYVTARVTQQARNPAHWYCIVGGPGSGKTSVINCLAQKGHAVVREAATDLIKQRQEQGISEPWQNRNFVADVNDLFYQRQLEVEKGDAAVVFFDRGPVDGIVYMSLPRFGYQQSIVDSLQNVLERNLYQQTVFFIEDLGFCTQDEVRHEALDEALAIGAEIRASYEALGFKVVNVPKNTIEARTQMILDHVAKETKTEEKAMKKYVLIGGFASKAADGGKAVCEEMVKGFAEPVKMLICLFARPEAGWASKFEEDKVFIAGHLPGKQLDMRMATIADFTEQAAWADVIYLRGGDTPMLVEALRKDPTWMQNLAGKTVVGTSAGACAIAQYDYDIDYFKLSDNLGLLPIKVLPHYRSDYGAPHVNWDDIEAQLQAYKEPLEFVALPEGAYRVFER